MLNGVVPTGERQGRLLQLFPPSTVQESAHQDSRYSGLHGLPGPSQRNRCL